MTVGYKFNKACQCWEIYEIIEELEHTMIVFRHKSLNECRKVYKEIEKELLETHTIS